MSVMAVTAALAGSLSCRTSHTGIIAVAVGMTGATVGLLSMHMPSRLGTALHAANTHNTAGTVAITAPVIITAVSLLIMNMISRLGTAFHRTYTHRAAGTVTVTALMIISAISLIIMGVQSGIHTIRIRTKPAYLIRRNCRLCMMSMRRYGHHCQTCHQQPCRAICQ